MITITKFDDLMKTPVGDQVVWGGRDFTVLHKEMGYVYGYSVPLPRTDKYGTVTSDFYQGYWGWSEGGGSSFHAPNHEAALTQFKEHAQESKKWWDDLFARNYPDSSIIVDGHHYTDGGKQRLSSTMLGHAGHTSYILKLEDGHTWETNNLWSQGRIPEEYRTQYKDTHVFIFPAQYLASQAIKAERYSSGATSLYSRSHAAEAC